MVGKLYYFLLWSSVGFWILCSGCGHTQRLAKVEGESTRQIDDMVRQQFAGKNVIFWDDEVRLGWGDFRKNYRSRNNYHASSATGIYSFWNCDSNRFSFVVGAFFDKNESWVMSWVQFDRRRKGFLLNHEQTHFDLTEVYARKIRREFARLQQPCRKSDDELNAIVNRYLEQFQEEEKRYDAETQHGIDERKQYDWDRKVYEQLDELQQFHFTKYVFPRLAGKE